MFLGVTPVALCHNSVLPSCNTPDVSYPSRIHVVLMQLVHNPDSKHMTDKLPHVED